MKTQDIVFSLFAFAIVIFAASCRPNIILNEPTLANNNTFINDSQIYILKDTTVKILWTAKQNETTGTTIFNNDYVDTMSDPERAAIGFISAFIKTDTGSKVNYIKGGTKLLPLLQFEQKSKEKKLAFLKQWFRYDKNCLNKLESSTAFCNSQKEFKELNMKVTSDTITVFFTAKENIPGGTSRWMQEDTFRLDQNSLQLIEEKQSKIN